MSNHLFLPILTLLLGSTLATILGRWRRVARGIVLLAISANFLYSSWLGNLIFVSKERQFVRVGTLIAPYGISFIADELSATMLFMTTFLTLLVVIFSFLTSIITEQIEDFFFYPLVLLILLGATGVFLTGDLFNLYVWFEVLLVSSFGLLTLGRKQIQLEGGLKFVELNLIGSALLLVGCGLIYGLVGTLNIGQITQRFQSLNSGLLTVLATLFLVAFSIKAAIFPTYFWLPASYHTPPSVVTALFAGILTKVGMYVFYRVFSLIFYINLVDKLTILLLILACLTMIVGIIGAIAQVSLRRMLSFHIICQTGYILSGLGLANEAGLAAGLFFMLHTMLVKTALLVIGGIAEASFGTDELKKMGGLAAREPLLATFWFLAMLSLAGFPPFSGFIGKLVLLKATLSAKQYLVAGVMAGVSLGTLFSLLKIWNEVFWKTLPKDEPEPAPIKPYTLIPAAILVGSSLLLGLGASVVLASNTLAAKQALDSIGYLSTVLPDSPKK